MEFDIVNELLNIDYLEKDNLPIYIDTDSLFLQLPCSLEHEREKALYYIDCLQTEINDVHIDKFLNLHNIKIRKKEEYPLLTCNFKNEYMIKSISLYAKKRYISVTIKYDNNNEIYFDIDLKGVEGKRATNYFIKSLVDDLLGYLKTIENVNNIYDRFDIYKNVICKYKEKILERKNYSYNENIEYFTLPVNVNKQISDLKNVAGSYRGTLVFDAISSESHWQGKVGKGKWLSVKLKDDSIIPKILNIYSEYKQIKTKGKKPNVLIRDITIPDSLLQKSNDEVDNIFKYFEIDYDSYIETLLKKIKLLYNPFDVIFCDELLKNNKKSIPSNFTIYGENIIYVLE